MADLSISTGVHFYIERLPTREFKKTELIWVQGCVCSSQYVQGISSRYKIITANPLLKTPSNWYKYRFTTISQSIGHHIGVASSVIS